MPQISGIEDTPNPNAKKFILNEPLTSGVTCSYDDADQAKADMLATALFEIEHVTNVFYVDRWLTVTQDGNADWHELERKVAEPINAAPAANAQTMNNVAETTIEEADINPEEQRLVAIKQLIDQQIRPTLQGDGGDLDVISLDGNLLSVHYQGACGSCPSSIAGTLRGIENLVRTIETQITVVAV